MLSIIIAMMIELMMTLMIKMMMTLFIEMTLIVEMMRRGVRMMRMMMIETCLSLK